MITITRTPATPPNSATYSLEDIRSMQGMVFKQTGCPIDGTTRFFSVQRKIFICQDNGWLAPANEHQWKDTRFEVAHEKLTITLD